MENTYLFMNWVFDRMDYSESNDFQAFVLYMRNSLTPQLWEDFIKSDSALPLTQSFVDSVKQKVVPKPKKPRAKKVESVPEIPIQNEVLREEEPVPVVTKTKKPRAKKVVSIEESPPVETPSLEVPIQSEVLREEEPVPVPLVTKTKKPRAKKTVAVQESSVMETPSLEVPNTPIQEGEVEQVVTKVKKPRTKKVVVEVPNTPIQEEGEVLREEEEEPVPVPVVTKVKKSRNSKSTDCSAELSQVVGTQCEEFQEIQLQLVHIDGREAFIDSLHNIVF